METIWDIETYTVDWKMSAIKNDCNFDSTLQIVNYLRCKINTNSSNSCWLVTVNSVKKYCESIFCDWSTSQINAFVFSRNHFTVYTMGYIAFSIATLISMYDQLDKICLFIYQKIWEFYVKFGESKTLMISASIGKSIRHIRPQYTTLALHKLELPLLVTKPTLARFLKYSGEEKMAG